MERNVELAICRMIGPLPDDLTADVLFHETLAVLPSARNPKVGITLDLYSHVTPNMQEDAVAKVEAAMKAARSKLMGTAG